jgi:NAD(P)-dependent dehydrogenase (short-subunit alcohol dehydrogenase family)
MKWRTMTRTDQELQAADGNGVRGRVALVTGGTRGIGEGISRRLAQQGAHVAVGYWRGDESAHEFQIQMKTDFPDCQVTMHKGNIGVALDCRRVISEVIEEHGRLDILVNNAGITMDRTVAKMADEQWQNVLDVNLSGAFYLSQAAMKHMLERGTGRIVAVSSVIGETGNIGQANYAASKSGLFGLTKSLALEAAFQLKRAGKLGDGIGLTVNAVTPGYIETEMLAAIPEKVRDGIRAQIPLGRLGRPDDIARTVCFLAGDEAAYVTGQTWSVNGGLDM